MAPRPRNSLQNIFKTAVFWRLSFLAFKVGFLLLEHVVLLSDLSVIDVTLILLLLVLLESEQNLSS